MGVAVPGGRARRGGQGDVKLAGGRWRKAVPSGAGVPGGRHVEVHAQQVGIQNNTGMRSQLATCTVCPAYCTANKRKAINLTNTAPLAA